MDKSYAYPVLTTGLEYPTNVPSNCLCNELYALTHRHLVEKVVDYDPELWKAISAETLKFFMDELEPLTLRQVVDGYSGAKKRRYERAKEYIYEHGLQSKHARIKMFIKNERFPKDQINIKPPRAIQYRTPEFTLCFMKYVRPMEEHYYPILTYGGVSGTRVVAKGLNAEQRAEIFMEKVRSFKRPKYVCIDHSAFDSTIRKDHIVATHRKYRRVFGKRCSWLMRMQLRNKGVTRGGIKYEVEGTRMSGDADTALGNTIINLDAIYGVLKHSGISKYDIMVDGDDGILVIEEEDEIDLSLFSKFGFVTKSKIVRDLHEIDFCQSRLVFRPRPIFVRDPRRAISNACLAKIKRKNQLEWLASYGECEFAVNQGVPILMQFGKSLKDASSSKAFDRDVVRRMELQVETCSEITDHARLSFYRSFGVPPPLQEMLEEEISDSIRIYIRDFKNDEQLQRTWTWSILSDEPSGSCWWYCG